MATNRRLAVMLLLGFASGLPLSLTGAALQAWMANEQVDIRTIGIFSLVGLPYTFKFVWSPLMDRHSVPLLGRRRGWMLVTQLALIIAIAAMALFSPTDQAMALAGAALIVAFLSASQDIAFDAYRTEVLETRERGMGVALSIGGYRLGMLVSGGLAFVLADDLGWRATYVIMAAFMGLGVLATIFAAPPPRVPSVAPASLTAALVGSLRQLLTRPGALGLIGLVVLYRLGDTYASSLTTPFLILPPQWLADPFGLQSGVGFSQTEVGLINKGVGVAAVLGGTAIAGVLMARWSLLKALLVFGVLQCLTNLSFMVLAEAGAYTELLVVVVALENLAGGMGTAALVALIMALCDRRYTATQFALLTAAAAVGRYLAGPTAGFVQAEIGWTAFFLITALTAVPGLALVARLRSRIRALDEAASAPPADE
jgi:PAT family beta-lactamase induction signal transducer AmpG